MKYPLYLPPLILLQALPAAAAEVEFVPAPSNVEATAPIQRLGNVESIEPLGEARQAPSVVMERRSLQPVPARSTPGSGAVDSIQPRGEARQPTATDAKQKTSGTRPVKEPSSTGKAGPARPDIRKEGAAHVSQPTEDTPTLAASGLSDDSSLAAMQARGDDRLKKYDQAMIAIAKASNEGRKEDALLMMKEIWGETVRLEDFGTMGGMAYIAMELNDEETAVMAASKAAELVDDDEFYEILANVLIRFNRLEEMQDVLKKMEPKSPERKRVLANFAVNKAKVAFDQGNYAEAEQALLEQHAALNEGGLELLGWTQYRLGKLDEATQQFSAAYAKKPASSNAQGLAFSLHRLKRYDELLQKAEAKPGPLAELLSPEVRESIKAGGKRFSVGPDGRLSVASGASSGPTPGVTTRLEATIREKPGTRGESRLSQRGIALATSWQGESDNVSLRVEGLRADDHVTESSGQAFYALWQHTAENGVAYSLGLGRTPTGGTVEPAWLGETGISYYTSDWGVSARLFRRGSDESLLAFTGKRDPVTGLDWGRVLQTGLALSGNRRLGEWNAIASLTAADLTGERVADNRKYELYSRTLHPVAAVPGLSLGPELILSHYRRNLSAFELGHGGYFSPDRYIQLGAVANYETRLDKLELNLLASIGHNWNRQDAAPGNPLTGAEPGKFAASSGRDIVYSALLDGAWPVSAQWRVGFRLGAQQSPSYSDWRLGLFAEGFYE